MKTLLVTIIGAFLAVALSACAVSEGGEPSDENPPLADTLSQTFSQLRQVALQRREDLLPVYMSHDVLTELRDSLSGQGYVTVSDYLSLAYRDIPDPDTLLVAGLTTGNGYARLSLKGRGYRWLRRQEMVRYTFVLFRYEDKSWKFVAGQRSGKGTPRSVRC